MAAADHPVLQLDEFGLQAEQLTEISGVIRCVAAFGTKSPQCHTRCQAIVDAVFQFEFHLLVVAVLQVTVDAFDRFFVKRFHQVRSRTRRWSERPY